MVREFGGQLPGTRVNSSDLWQSLPVALLRGGGGDLVWNNLVREEPRHNPSDAEGMIVPRLSTVNGKAQRVALLYEGTHPEEKAGSERPGRRS